MLSYLTLKHHRHLVKLLATYTLKGYFHLLFPFADANLRSYWKKIGIPAQNLETYIWCIDQLTGLASGLNVIHNFQPLKEVGVHLGSDSGNDGLSRLRPSGVTNFRLIVDGGESIYGRHVITSCPFPEWRYRCMEAVSGDRSCVNENMQDPETSR